MQGIPLQIVRVFLLAALIFSSSVRADEPIVVPPSSPVSFVDRATATAQDAIDQAMDLLGIRYRRGGSSPEAGFDCSGFVSHVFREGVGLILPRSSREMSKSGQEISKDELRPGDLVFFNTMRRAFSHVGIYVGDNQFVHAPRSGGRVRIEDLRDGYWTKRFNGARRVNPD
ncbi:MAG: C40 family peptidase [Rhodocyclales bacterium]|jgi:cell wall-associated NlpC family hydrolase|nr:C40 family peptidase [Rhodocyclales bacterium]